jgi:hypothetical protein
VNTPAVVVTGEVEGERSMMGISAADVIAAWRRLGTR